MKICFLFFSFLTLLSIKAPSLHAKNWDIFADLFIWYASEETSSFVANVVTENPPKSFDFDVKNMRFNWDLGFKVGIGYTTEYDMWDTQVYWTWYRTESSREVKGNSAVITPEFFAGFIVGLTHEDEVLSGKVKWTILYNMFDWELGRNFCVSKAFAIRPFIGVKGGFINQTLDPRWQNITAAPATLFSAKEDVKNNFWGIGPDIGINTQWKFAHFCNSDLNFFGDFAAATLFGTWNLKDNYLDTMSRKLPVKVKRSSSGALMLRGFCGIGWNIDCRFSAKLGYEMQLWSSQLKLPTFQQLILHGDLTLQGGTLECRLNF